MEWNLGSPEVQSPAQVPAPGYTPPEMGVPVQGGSGGIQYETEDGTPLNIQNQDGTPLDLGALQPGESVTVYGTDSGAPQEIAPPQQVQGNQPQPEVNVPVITAEEMAQVEKSQREFGNMVLAILIGIGLVFVAGVVLIVRSVRKRSRKKREALENDLVGSV
jgi:hypothetical protein